jgi:hypothetical protein
VRSGVLGIHGVEEAWPNIETTPAKKKLAMINPIIVGVPPRCSRKRGRRGSPNVAPMN